MKKYPWPKELDFTYEFVDLGYVVWLNTHHLYGGESVVTFPFPLAI
jgi:hypothetical protein